MKALPQQLTQQKNQNTVFKGKFCVKTKYPAPLPPKLKNEMSNSNSHLKSVGYTPIWPKFAFFAARPYIPAQRKAEYEQPRH